MFYISAQNVQYVDLNLSLNETFFRVLNLTLILSYLKRSFCDPWTYVADCKCIKCTCSQLVSCLLGWGAKAFFRLLLANAKGANEESFEVVDPEIKKKTHTYKYTLNLVQNSI